MTKRKPLRWFNATVAGIGVDGQLPDCVQCCDLLLTPMFVEAVCSVAIEHPGSPADLARRTIDSFHARRHPADMRVATRQ